MKSRLTQERHAELDRTIAGIHDELTRCTKVADD